MVVNNLLDLLFDDMFISIDDLIENNRINLKLEGLSVGGSIKIKPALKMINRLEINHRLGPDITIIESSSGNLGIALSIVCAVKGYNFICVVDPNVLELSEKLMRSYGAQVVKVTEKDHNGGFLNTRINYIQERIKNDSKLIWVNQYENIDNVESHYLATGPAIIRQFPKLDFVFVGAGTTGTLSGVSHFIRSRSPRTKIIAVDSVGSVNFGRPGGKRLIPGLGASTATSISKLSTYDTLLSIREADTIKMCHRMARKGLLLGGSTGTVLAAVEQYQHQMPPGSNIVAISPDFGERYLSTIYNPEWVAKSFPDLYTNQVRTDIEAQEGVLHRYA